jgi:GT2 family glycosyltransferase/SAM-dependent methyltransferase
VLILHLDLADRDGLPSVEPETRVVLWWRSLPLGQFDVHHLPTAPWLASEIARAAAPAVAERLAPGSVGNWLPGERGRRSPATSIRAIIPESLLPALDDLDIVADVDVDVDASDLSVIVCTRARPESLRRTLEGLEAQRARPGAIVVVDNDPQGVSARAVVADFPRVRLIEEPRPGLSRARNAGLRAVRTSFIAFTDDDAMPHPAWAAQVVRVLRRDPSTLGVTGLVIPAELHTDGAVRFEERSGFGQGYLPRRYDTRWFHGQRWKATPAWKVGAGANMAFRREVFERVGGFDERLGAGASGCSEDSELWYRLLADGGAIEYEPAAVVFHHHRTGAEQVASLMEAYSEGHVSALFVQFARHPHPGDLLRVGFRLPWYYATRRLRHGRDPIDAAEIRGYRAGLRHWSEALRATPAPAVAPPVGPEHAGAVAPAGMSTFLRRNPFPHPRTEGFFYREKMRAIRRVTPDEPVRRVLELGGGRSGLGTRLFPGASVVSLDLDPIYGAEVTSADPTRFMVGDVVHLPFLPATFDVVTMFDLLEHVEADDRAVAEALRVVRPGGVVLVSTPTADWRYPFHASLASVCPEATELTTEWGHVRNGYEIADLERLFGAPAESTAYFITPVTAIAHDLAFSKLRPRLRRALIAALAPVVWSGYAMHDGTARGLEVAGAWRRP